MRLHSHINPTRCIFAVLSWERECELIAFSWVRESVHCNIGKSTVVNSTNYRKGVRIVLDKLHSVVMLSSCKSGECRFPFIIITPKSTLIRSGNTFKDTLYSGTRYVANRFRLFWRETHTKCPRTRSPARTGCGEGKEDPREDRFELTTEWRGDMSAWDSCPENETVSWM